MQIAPYLLFDGNCRDVMSFYAQCFGGLLEFVTYGECSPDDPLRLQTASGKKDDIVYASLRDEETLVPFITAADLPFEAQSSPNNGQITINCTSEKQIEQLIQQLSQGGKVIQVLTNVFWSACIAKVVDKYGVHWFLYYEVD